MGVVLLGQDISAAVAAGSVDAVFWGSGGQPLQMPRPTGCEQLRCSFQEERQARKPSITAKVAQFALAQGLTCKKQPHVKVTSNDPHRGVSRHLFDIFSYI